MPDLIAALSDFLSSGFVLERRGIDPMRQRMMDGALFQWLRDNKVLIPSQSMRGQLTCPGCEQQCMMDVETIRRHDNSFAYAIACDKREDIGLVALERHEVQPCLPDIPALCSVLAAALASVDAAVKASIPDVLYRLGRGTVEGAGYTFFFALSLADERTIASHPDYMNASNPVVLAAQRPEQATLPVVTLDALFTVQEGQLRLFPAALTGLYGSKVTPEQHIFRKDGDVWLVAYQGKQARIKHTKGCAYVRHLLGNPQQAYTASQLQALVDRPALANETYSAMSTEALEAEGLAVATDSADDVVDVETYRTSLKTINAKIKEAEVQGAGAKLNRLKQQKTDIETYLKQNTNIRGKSRKVANESEKVRQAVRSAIATVCKNLSKELPELGKHLQASLKTGHSCAYEPELPLRWQV